MQVVSVIMPTLALVARGALVRRALDSVLGQQGVRAVPVVVINGPSRDPALTRDLRADRRLRVAMLEQPDLPAALRAGRELVDTPFFAELDDDDVLLPGALAARVQALQDPPQCDVVVTNGFRRHSGSDTPIMADVSRVEQNPLGALLERNWLLPGSWLCRTDAVGPGIFDGMPKFFECTYLALRFATGYRIRFVDRPTVVWHADTPQSASKSRDYLLGHVAALRRILELDLPPDVRAGFRCKVAGVHHNIAARYLREGELKQAWRWHLQSLREPTGWHHLRFTLRLLQAAWKV